MYCSIAFHASQTRLKHSVCPGSHVHFYIKTSYKNEEILWTFILEGNSELVAHTRGVVGKKKIFD